MSDFLLGYRPMSIALLGIIVLIVIIVAIVLFFAVNLER